MNYVDQTAEYVTKAGKHRIMAHADLATTTEMGVVYFVAYCADWHVSPWFLAGWMAVSCVGNLCTARAYCWLASDLWAKNRQPRAAVWL